MRNLTPKTPNFHHPISHLKFPCKAAKGEVAFKPQDRTFPSEASFPRPSWAPLPGTSGRPGEGCTHVPPCSWGQSLLDYRTRGWVFLKGRQGFPPIEERSHLGTTRYPKSESKLDSEPTPPGPHPKPPLPHPRLMGPLTFHPAGPCCIRVQL